jgi:hypothetical protein
MMNILQTNTSIDFLEVSPVVDASRSKDFREQLLEWRKDRRMLVVITKKRMFNLMVITQIDESMTSDNAEAYSATISMEEIIRVDSELVSLGGSGSASSTPPAGNSSKSGRKSAKPANRAKRSSVLAALGRWVGGG